MKVFISQSGERSLALATTLESFLRKVVQNVEPWMSKTAIDKGARFPEEIRNNLSESEAGILCLTSDNLDERWLLFEAGALSLKPADRVWTFLLDVPYGQVKPPLSDFQHTKAEKAEVFELVKSIHKTVSAKEKSTKDSDLMELFETFWAKELEPKIGELQKKGPATTGTPLRPPAEIMAEVLETVRDVHRQGQQDSWRVSKTMMLLTQLYRITTGTPAPSMKQLMAMREEQAAAVEHILPKSSAVAEYREAP